MVPCHRVVYASKGIGGFSGQTSAEHQFIQNKTKLLRGEGVDVQYDERIKNYRVIESEQIVDLPPMKFSKEELQDAALTMIE